MLLDIVQVAQSHSGANLAVVFTKILDNFRIACKVSMRFGIMDQSILTYVQILGVTRDNVSNNNVMIQQMQELISKFPGKANQIRCFAHIINLVAKSVIKQFDLPKGTAASCLDDAIKGLLALAGDIELEEDDMTTSLDEDDMDKDDNIDGWRDKRDTMSTEKLQKLNADVLPVCQVLVRASWLD